MSVIDNNDELIMAILANKTFLHGDPYHEPPSIAILRTPRFGHTNDLVGAFLGPHGMEDYLAGLFAVPVFILSVFAIWSAVLILTFPRCRKSKRQELEVKCNERALSTPGMDSRPLSSSANKTPYSAAATELFGSPRSRRMTKSPSSSPWSYFATTPEFKHDDKSSGEDEDDLSTVTFEESRASSSNKTSSTGSAGEDKTPSSNGKPSSTDDSTMISLFSDSVISKCLATVVCVIVFMIFSIVFVTKGVTHSQSALDIVHNSAASFRCHVVEPAQDLFQDQLPVLVPLARNVTRQMKKQLGGKDSAHTTVSGDAIFKPPAWINKKYKKQQAICTGDPSFDQRDVVRQLRTSASSILNELEPLIDMTSQSWLSSLEAVLHSASSTSIGIQDMVASVSPLTDWHSILILAPYVLIAGAVLSYYLVFAAVNVYGVFPRWYSRTTIWLYYVVVPILVLLVVLAWIALALFLAAGGANRDICVPPATPASLLRPSTGPDSSILRAVHELSKVQTQGKTGKIFDGTVYYATFCSVGQHPLRTFLDYKPQLQDYDRALSYVGRRLYEDAAFLELALYCHMEEQERDDHGTMHARSSKQTSMELESLLHSVHELLKRSLLLISSLEKMTSCSTIVPLYERAMYHGLCGHALLAWKWLSLGALIVAVAGMMLLTIMGSL